MSNLIATDAQMLSSDQLVELFEIDASAHGAGILRFTATSIKGAPVKFNGLSYLPVPIQAKGFEWSGSGTLPRPTLEMTVPDTSFISLLVSSADLVGCPVKRIRTRRKYLDDGTNPNPTATYPAEHYSINRKTEQSRYTLAFELTPKMDQEGRRVPALQIIRDTCRHSFRKWNGYEWDYTGVTCPYAGDEMYDANGLATPDPKVAQCGKRLSDCSVHFGKNNVLPFRGFPGVGRI